MAVLAAVCEARTAGGCSMECNDMRREVLTMEMCRYVLVDVGNVASPQPQQGLNRRLKKSLCWKELDAALAPA